MTVVVIMHDKQNSIFGERRRQHKKYTFGFLWKVVRQKCIDVTSFGIVVQGSTEHMLFKERHNFRKLAEEVCDVTTVLFCREA